jgi:hypothetical protein
MAAEALTFGIASMLHLTVEVFRDAAIPEAIIGIVLLAAAVAVLARRTWARGAALTGTIFATIGTVIGVFAVTTGPNHRGPIDIAYHFTILVALVATIAAIVRTER